MDFDEIHIKPTVSEIHGFIEIQNERPLAKTGDPLYLS